MEIANDVVLLISEYLDVFELNYFRLTCKKYYKLLSKIAEKRNPKLWRLYINLDEENLSAEISPKNSYVRQFTKNKYNWIRDFWIISNSEWYDKYLANKYKSTDDYRFPESLMLSDVLNSYYSPTTKRKYAGSHVYVWIKEDSDGCEFIPIRIYNFSYYHYRLDKTISDDMYYFNYNTAPVKNGNVCCCELKIFVPEMEEMNFDDSISEIKNGELYIET